jgi:long-subunit acyl-CoA synthetase (AMP-forming)
MKHSNKTQIINMRITKEKKEQLKRVTDALKCSRTQLLENYVDTLINLYQ